MITPPLPGVSIAEGPADWQIIQQGPDHCATVSLAGVCLCEAPEYRVEARVVHEINGAPVAVHLDWRAARLDPDDRWRMTIAGIPAGGLYRLETRIRRSGGGDNRPMRGDYVHHWGVGDIWAIAGQSNAAGTGTGVVDDPPRFGVHQFGSDHRWKIATHPLEDATFSRHRILVHGVAQGHSPWLAFGRVLQRQLGCPIAVIPAAMGGSAISRWIPGADLFVNLVQMVRAAGGQLRGIVWYQGESDAIAGRSLEYPSSFTRFAGGIREALGQPGLPIITAQLGRYADALPGDPIHESWSRLREVQREIAQRTLQTPLVPTIDLALCDFIHLSAGANLELGQRFAAAVLRVIAGPAHPSPGISLLGAAWAGSDRRRLVLNFDAVAGGWVMIGPCHDFSVFDSVGPVPVSEVICAQDHTIELLLARPAGSRAEIAVHRGCMPPVSLRDRDQRPILAFRVALQDSTG